MESSVEMILIATVKKLGNHTVKGMSDGFAADRVIK